MSPAKLKRGPAGAGMTLSPQVISECLRRLSRDGRAGRLRAAQRPYAGRHQAWVRVGAVGTRWQKLQRTANLQIGIFCAILIGLAGFASLLTGDPLPVACISYTCIVVGLLLLLLHL